MNQKTKGFVLGTIGFLLSPLTWWNDLVVNLPLAYVFASLFDLISEKLFFPAMIVGYWLTNILGFVLMDYGADLAIRKERRSNIWKSILISCGYTLIIVVLIKLNILKSPIEYFNRFR